LVHQSATIIISVFHRLLKLLSVGRRRITNTNNENGFAPHRKRGFERRSFD
jgi:hypothetical protein